MVPFYLKSLSSSPNAVKCLVLKCLETNSEDIMQKIGIMIQEFDLGWLKKFVVWTYYFLEILFGVFKAIKPLNGIRIGVTSKEFGIIAGSIITVIGKAIYNMKTK